MTPRKRYAADPDASDRPSTGLEVQVECYAGFRSEESPRRFSIGARAVAVVEILDRWLSPAHYYFKLRGDDGGIYILRYDVARDRWEMTLFNSGERPDLRLSST